MADYALIVGIEHYMTASITPVRYAEAVGAFVRSPERLTSEHSSD